MNLTTTSADSGADSVTWVIHGKAGTGKTSMLATVPDPSRLLYVNIEGGLIPQALRGAGAAQVSWNMLEQSAEDFMREVYRYLKGTGARLYDWVAIDSATALADDVIARLKAEEARSAKPNTMRAYGDLADKVKALITAFRALPLNVVLICKAALIEQPEGHKIGAPAMPGTQLKEWLPHEVDGIFALVVATKGRGDDKTTIRYLKTCADGVHEAKDRSGMLDAIERPDLSVMHNKVMRGLAPKEK